MVSHKRITRIMKRVLDELRSTWEVARVTSWRGAAVSFLAKVDIQIMNRNGCKETEKVKRRLLEKHETMLAYFEKEFSDFSPCYDSGTELPQDNPKLHDRIWICWWQGLSNAPELVKACVDSIIRNAGSRQVTIVTEENYQGYANIPLWVQEKYHKGIISRTHYSDILRLSLLAEHGGMWLDATFFCTSPVLENYFQLPLWSIKRPGYRHGSVACGQFATYALACSYENRWIFAEIRDYVLNYWQKKDYLIDYLFLDYLFVLAQRKNPQLHKAFQMIEPNNPRCDDLCNVLNCAFDLNKWERMQQDTYLYKLTWKQDFQLTMQAQESFYARLIQNSLMSGIDVKK